MVLRHSANRRHGDRGDEQERSVHSPNGGELPASQRLVAGPELRGVVRESAIQLRTPQSVSDERLLSNQHSPAVCPSARLVVPPVLVHPFSKIEAWAPMGST